MNKKIKIKNKKRLMNINHGKKASNFLRKNILKNHNSKNNNGIMVLPEWQGGEHRVILEIYK